MCNCENCEILREKSDREFESVRVYFEIEIEMSKDLRRRLRVRSLRFWKMIQKKREKGEPFRNVRVELKDG